jgi:hypothetical protein
MRCPHCLQKVNAFATRCPHCTGDIDPVTNATSEFFSYVLAIGFLILVAMVLTSCPG